MTEQTVVEIGTRAILVALSIAAPALIVSMLAGLLIAIFQAATQINEQTLSFIPKIVFMMLAFILCGPWIIQTIMFFTIGLYKEIPFISMGP